MSASKPTKPTPGPTTMKNRSEGYGEITEMEIQSEEKRKQDAKEEASKANREISYRDAFKDVLLDNTIIH